jgi:DNA-binding NarL/FixJ family response regulator
VVDQSTDTLRVLIVAPYPTLQYGLRAALESAEDLEVAALASDLEQALALLEGEDVDVLLADVEWGREEFSLLAASPDALPLTLLAEEAATAAECFLAGAQAVLLRDATSEEIVAAIRATAAGLTVLDSRVRSELAVTTTRSAMPRSDQATLSARELQVLELIAQGLPNKSIALELGISEHTVKFHVGSILTKLDAASRSEALARAIQAGLIAV